MTGRSLEQILQARKSVRAYLPKPVAKAQVAALLALARSAPSGANLQPGYFHALSGGALDALKKELAQAVQQSRPHVAEYSYFPNPMPAYLKSRQRAAGYALYNAAGINRRDVAARKAQFARNYAFFDAPVGIVVTIERAMGKGCYMDLGMALMAFLAAAEARGLGASGIGALANYGDLVHAHLGLPDDQLVVCGMALGYPDTDAAVNRFRTSREPLDTFASFAGFSDAE